VVYAPGAPWSAGMVERQLFAGRGVGRELDVVVCDDAVDPADVGLAAMFCAASDFAGIDLGVFLLDDSR